MPTNRFFLMRSIFGSMIFLLAGEVEISFVRINLFSRDSRNGFYLDLELLLFHPSSGLFFKGFVEPIRCWVLDFDIMGGFFLQRFRIHKLICLFFYF